MGLHNENNLVGLMYSYPGNSISDFTKQFPEFLLTNNILQNTDICIFGDICITSTICKT